MYDRLCKYAELKGQTLTKAVERLIDYNIDEDGNSKAQTNKTAWAFVNVSAKEGNVALTLTNIYINVKTQYFRRK